MHKYLGIFLFLVAGQVFAQGGPPLVTDDPGTPGDGRWEINSSLQASFSDPSAILQFPLFDINYGYGDHIQLNLNTSYINVNQYGSQILRGLGVASVGVKWRFIDEESAGVAVSTYPRIDFHHGFSSADPAVNTPGTHYFLPVEFSKEFGPFGFNPEIGYASYTQFASEWVFGLAASYRFSKEKEALFEIHGRSLVGSTDRELLYNFGTRYGITENLSFIGSVGKTFQSYSDQVPAWNLYAGVQLRL